GQAKTRLLVELAPALDVRVAQLSASPQQEKGYRRLVHPSVGHRRRQAGVPCALSKIPDPWIDQFHRASSHAVEALHGPSYRVVGRLATIRRLAVQRLRSGNVQYCRFGSRLRTIPAAGLPTFAMPSAAHSPPRAYTAALPDELLEALVACGSVRKFPRNTIVVLEGEPAETLYIVIEGELRVYVSDDEGREAELSRLGPNEYFGEMMLDSRVRTASVRTLSPARLCVVQRADFERLIQVRPDLALHLIQTLIRRIMALTGSVQSLALMDVYGRVARLLVE